MAGGPFEAEPQSGFEFAAKRHRIQWSANLRSGSRLRGQWPSGLQGKKNSGRGESWLVPSEAPGRPILWKPVRLHDAFTVESSVTA
jgi:hypothetical protein